MVFWGELNDAMKKLILLQTPTEFVWGFFMWWRILTTFCMQPVIVHSSPYGSVSWLLWLDVKIYWGLSAVTEISWSSAFSCKALYSAICYEKFMHGILELLVNIGWLLFPLIYYVPVPFVFKVIILLALWRVFWKIMYLGSCHKECILIDLVRIHKSCCRINKMCCFQEPAEYIPSEYWKGCRLPSFLCLCPLVCHHPKL